jgi:hypothetical protein
MHAAYWNVSAKVASGDECGDDDDSVGGVIIGKESLQFRLS